MGRDSAGSRFGVKELATLGVGSLALLSAIAALAKGQQDFTLHNGTGVEIDTIYISPHGLDGWKEVLGADTLPDGASVQLTFDPRERAERWDIQVVDAHGVGIEWEDLNLMEIADLTLLVQRGKAVARTGKPE